MHKRQCKNITYCGENKIFRSCYEKKHFIGCESYYRNEWKEKKRRPMYGSIDGIQSDMRRADVSEQEVGYGDYFIIKKNGASLLTNSP